MKAGSGRLPKSHPPSSEQELFPPFYQRAPLREPVAALVRADRFAINRMPQAGFLHLERRIGLFLNPGTEGRPKAVRTRVYSLSPHER